jgi:hypothetical protein
MAMLNNQRVNSDLWSIEVLLELSSKNYSFLLHWINNLELSFFSFLPLQVAPPVRDAGDGDAPSL